MHTRSFRVLSPLFSEETGSREKRFPGKVLGPGQGSDFLGSRVTATEVSLWCGRGGTASCPTPPPLPIQLLSLHFSLCFRSCSPAGWVQSPGVQVKFIRPPLHTEHEGSPDVEGATEPQDMTLGQSPPSSGLTCPTWKAGALEGGTTQGPRFQRC